MGQRRRGNGLARLVGHPGDRRSRGRSIKTSNLYLDAIKGFLAWMVQDRRAADNPLAHLSGGNDPIPR